jgi:hypothetical protein
MAKYLLPLLMIWSITPETTALFTAPPPNHSLRFDVTDPREIIAREIDATLLLRVLRIAHSRVPHFGWEVQVAERDAGSTGPNVLRRGIASGGPHPSDVLAWLSHERYFPDDRRLPLPGYPYELRIRLIDCRTASIGEDIGFVSGSVEITWRRLDLAANRDRVRVSRFAVVP